MEYFKIGRIAGTHGVAGKIVVRHSLGKRTALDGVDAIFVEEGKESFLPWFIQSASAKSDDEFFLDLDGVDSKEGARMLLKKDVWLQEDDFKRLAAEDAAISLLGFHIYDQGLDLGEILEVIEQPHQTLCRIMLEKKEAWIPVHEASLINIDRSRKKVFVSLPDGLLDVYR